MKKLLLIPLIGFTPCVQPITISPSKAIAGLAVAASACKLTHCLYTKYTLHKQIQNMRAQLRTTQLKGNDRLNRIKELNALIARSNKNDITAGVSLAACGAGTYYLLLPTQPRHPRGNVHPRPFANEDDLFVPEEPIPHGNNEDDL